MTNLVFSRYKFDDHVIIFVTIEKCQEMDWDTLGEAMIGKLIDEVGTSV